MIKSEAGTPILADLKLSQIVQATDLQNGSYLVAANLTKAGVYSLTATLNGDSLGGSPFLLHVAAGMAKAGESTLASEVSHTIAGRALFATLQAQDGFGNPRLSGGDLCTFVILRAAEQADAASAPAQGAEAQELSHQATADTRTFAASAHEYRAFESAPAEQPCLDNKNGTYSIMIIPVRSGNIAIYVTLNGERMDHSPFAVHVRASSTSAVTTKLVPSVPSVLAAGKQAPFRLEAKDEHGNQRIQGDVFCAIPHVIPSAMHWFLCPLQRPSPLSPAVLNRPLLVTDLRL